MVNFIYGKSGSGKSVYIYDKIANDLKNGYKAMLLVPEQQAVLAEDIITDVTDEKNVPTINLSVVNFTRLCNIVFRTFGGLFYNYIGKGAKKIIMWRTLSDISSLLNDYKNIPITDINTLNLMLDTVNEFTRYNITPQMLDEASEGLLRDDEKTNKSLSSKLKDLSLIYSVFKKTLKIEYNDPEEDLQRLCDLLKDHDFFCGYNVYIDSFTGFTSVQYDIIEKIINQADNVTISFGYIKNDDSLHFDILRETDNKIKKIINNKKEIEEIVFYENKRTKKSDIIKYSDNIWDYKYKNFTNEKCENIKVIECGDIYTESEAAAHEILKNVRSGYLFRDNLIITRDTEMYRGVIDAVLEKYDIPYFISQRVDIQTKAPIKLILTALKIISGKWNYIDIISYAKTGYAGIEFNECDILESYAYTWNIQGSRWTDTDDWKMNPNGYTDIFTDENKILLKKINEIRYKLIKPLLLLKNDINSECTLKQASEALYKFLIGLDINKRLFELSESEPIQLWNIISDSLDQLITIAGDVYIDAEKFMRLLGIMFYEADIGRIPTSLDEVTIADAVKLRADKVKNIIIIGLNDGIFPKNITDDNIFCDADRIKLENYGIVLSPKIDLRLSDELYVFYKSVSCASDNILLTYSKADLSGREQKISSALTRLYNIFPSYKPQKFIEKNIIDLIETPETSLQYFSASINPEIKNVLFDYYKENNLYNEFLSLDNYSLNDIYNNLREESLKKLYKGDLRFSYTRLDKYIKCNFSYYCTYVLRLKEIKKADFRSVDIGTYIHHILEQFFLRIKTENGIVIPDQKNIDIIVDDIINEYISLILQGIKTNTRINQLFRRLRKTSDILIKNIISEFSQSSFIPEFFELPIDFSPEGIPPLKIPISDGSYILISGIADRVDVYKKGKDIYFRIIDYKTGKLDFDFNNVEMGLNLQLLLYLFSVWTNPTDNFFEKIQSEKSDNMIPAGIIYKKVKYTNKTLSEKKDSADIINTLIDSFDNKALLINDDEILGLMEDKYKKENKKISMKTVEEFGILMKDIVKIVSNIGNEIKKGEVCVKPVVTKENDSCKYCPHKPICRLGWN